MSFFNKRRSDSVTIPDIPLNNVKLCSGVAARILSGQFDDDISWYRTHFNAFLVTHYKKDFLGLDKDVLRKIDKYAVNTDNKNKSPDSIATLVRAEELKDEFGAIVQNAIIYAIAMSIASGAKTQEMKDTIARTSMLRGASNTQTPEEYRTFMLYAHPRASAIAETLAHLESKKVAHNIVTMMGYLIDKGDIGADETERQKVERIFDEQMIGA